MEIKELLKELRENEVSLSLDGENLRLKFDHQELPGELVGKIKAAKNAIISYLKENSTTADLKAAITPVPLSDEGYVLSSSQQRLWVLSQFEDGLAAYNITHQVELNGQYDITLFKRAVFAVLERHEILRTAFKKNSEGETRQYHGAIRPKSLFSWDRHFRIARLTSSGRFSVDICAHSWNPADPNSPSSSRGRLGWGWVTHCGKS